jgi:hypothetical protein
MITAPCGLGGRGEGAFCSGSNRAAPASEPAITKTESAHISRRRARGPSSRDARGADVTATGQIIRGFGRSGASGSPAEPNC